MDNKNRQGGNEDDGDEGIKVKVSESFKILFHGKFKRT